MNCDSCGKALRIGEWPYCSGNGIHGRPHGRQGGVVHPRERAVVYRHPQTGKIAYPPRNDSPMPANLQSWGYERIELPTLHAVETLEKEANVRSEIAWYDQGTARGHDDHAPQDKPIDLTGLEFGAIE